VQQRDGTPVEVPVPKNKISIIFVSIRSGLKNQCSRWLFIVRIGFVRVKEGVLIFSFMAIECVWKTMVEYAIIYY